MRHLAACHLFGLLVLIWAAAQLPLAHGAAASSDAGSYVDVNTGVSFSGLESPNGFSFGMILPQNPTTDLVAQIVTPVADGAAGWGGVTFGSSMVGPLLLVTWANANKVMTAARIAHGHSAAAVVPYTAHQITISPIPDGTFINSTHISSTFLCGGCINSDSFDPAWASDDGTSNRDIFFSYAFSKTAVASPSDINTALSDHTGLGAGYSAFRVELSATKSDDYDRYAAMAKAAEPQDSPTAPVRPTASATAAPTASATGPSGGGCYGTECETQSGSDYSHREMPHLELYVLMVVGAVYLGQALMD